MPTRALKSARAIVRAFMIAAAAQSLASAAVGHGGGGGGGGGHHGGASRLPQPAPADISPQQSTAAAADAAAASLAAAAAVAAADNRAILQIEGEQVQARNRATDLAAWLIAMVAIQTVIFGVALFTALRAAKSARGAVGALPMLERAYIFLDQDISLTHGDHRGPHGGLKVSFEFGLKNHGKTPAVIRWINIRHQYLAEPPEGIYDEAGPGEGRIIGAGATLRFDHHDTIIPGADWDKAEAGDGSIYLHGRVVYWDILKGQHETYFCWRYDHAHGAFQIADSAPLNRFD
jgi:hypothetical protein